MTVERIILIIAWIIGVSFLFVIPRQKRRLATVAFLMKQAITCPAGLIVVEFDWIQYPVRFFYRAHRASFSFEFFLYPIICSLFNVFYPSDRHWLYKLLYILAFPTAITIPEYFLEKYTNVIVYVHWTWYWTWITLLITFLMSRGLCVWFFRGLDQKNSPLK